MSRRGGSGQDAIFASLRAGVKFTRPASVEKRASQEPTTNSAPAPFPSHRGGYTTEELAALRNRRKIRVKGDAPSLLPDVASLRGAGVPEALMGNIAAMGWATLTDTQMQSIPTLLAGRDLLSIAPTGSGKTGAFVIPLLSRLLSRPPASRPDLFVTTLPEGTLGIHFDEMWPVVSEVEDDGLAARREPRIRAGCRLLSINGRAMDRLAFQDAVPLIQQRPVQLLWQDEAAAGENTGAAATSSATQPSPRAVILAPTRELATQIARETKLLAAGTALVTALLEHQDTLDPSILGECDVLVSTPMRLAALIRSASCRLEAVELDEGDKLLEVGENKFLQQVDTIVDACGRRSRLQAKLQDATTIKKGGLTDTEMSKKKNKKEKKMSGSAAAGRTDSCAEGALHIQRCLFSATLPPQVEELARSFLREPVHITVGQRNGAATTVHQELLFVGDESGKLLAMRQLLLGGLRPPILVFVQSRARAGELLEELRSRGWKAQAIHSGLAQEERDLAMRRLRLGDLWALVCTEVLSRGIDVKHVSCVVNFDFPQTIVSYIHRIGRTGRAGRPGRAVTFFTEVDKDFLRPIAQVIQDAGCSGVAPWMLAAPKPSKKRRRELAKAPVKRRHISTKVRTKFRNPKPLPRDMRALNGEDPTQPSLE